MTLKLIYSIMFTANALVNGGEYLEKNMCVYIYVYV